MRSKYRAFLPLIALILTASFSYGKDFGYKTTKHSGHHYFATKTRDNNHDNYTPLINPTEPVLIISMQTHKVAQSVQAIFSSSNEEGYCIKCYNFFSGRGNHQAVCSKTPLLYPFHSFW